MILFQEEGNFQEGALILVDKPLKWTSFDVVNKIRWCLRKKYGKLKVGHAGTLDPLATGLVLVCVGRWTKNIEKYMGQEKEYRASLCFGATTPSFDLETEVDASYPYDHIEEGMLKQILEQQFTGVISQVPPVFSAIRVDGVRAYEKARKGKGPEMQAREVFIRKIELLRLLPPVADIRIVCGKGTYIRSLARDIGAACRSGAYLSGLRRTAIGEFRVEDAKKIENLVDFLQEKA